MEKPCPYYEGSIVRDRTDDIGCGGIHNEIQLAPTLENRGDPLLVKNGETFSSGAVYLFDMDSLSTRGSES